MYAGGGVASHRKLQGVMSHSSTGNNVEFLKYHQIIVTM